MADAVIDRAGASDDPATGIRQPASGGVLEGSGGCGDLCGMVALGLLDDLDGQARRDRVALITWLLRNGFALEHIRAAPAPILLPANRVLGDDGRYVSAREICETTGITLDVMERLQGAVGLPRITDPDAPVLLRVDAEAVAHAKMFLDMGADPDATVAVMQALMQGLAPAAAIMREAAVKLLLRPGATEIELAQATEEFTARTDPLLGPMIEDLLRLQLRHAVESEAVNAAERAVGTLPGAREVSVAFADVAGFTTLGQAVPAEELQRVASRLVDLAQTVAVVPVRFVKSIGDAVMLVSPDPLGLLRAVLELTGAVEADDLPRLRIGVATGQAVTRGGDWFGHPVNVASRVTALARPGAVMVAESCRRAVLDNFDASGLRWVDRGSHRLKGVHDQVQLYELAAEHRTCATSRPSGPAAKN